MSYSSAVSARLERPPEGSPAAPDGANVHYIYARSPATDEHTRVLKHGDTFAVFDRYGDIKPEGLGEEGIFHEGTRYLSSFLLILEHDRPLFLSSTIKQEN